jgi:uncharacterized protein YdaU (DUF1376 family)
MDTNEWSAEAFGIYNRLLHHQWVNGSIPFDMKTLAQISFVGIKMMTRRWKEMASKFEFDDTHRGRNKRLEETREKQRQYIEKQREKGKKRASKMWEGHVAAAMTPAIKRLQPKDSPSSSTSSSTSKRKNFIIPSLDEVTDYCVERRNVIKPQTFIDHYTGNGWKVGSNPMKDWKAVIRTWETRGGNGNGGIRTNRSDPRDAALQSREDAEIAAITARWEAAKKSTSDKAGRVTGDDDAPDFQGE